MLNFELNQSWSLVEKEGGGKMQQNKCLNKHNKWFEFCNNHKYKHNIFYIKFWSGLATPSPNNAAPIHYMYTFKKHVTSHFNSFV